MRSFILGHWALIYDAKANRPMNKPPIIMAFSPNSKSNMVVTSVSPLGRLLNLDDLVFANIEGKPIAPGVLSHNLHRITKKAGLENGRFHDLRHTFASLMLLQGAKPKVISEALGHSSVAFTMDVYSHIIEGMGAEAMALLDEVLPAGINGIRKNNGNLTAKLDIILA
jgi:integrase